MAQAAPKLDPAPTASIWEYAAASIAGTYSDPETAAAKLREAAKYCRLIGGAAITPFVDGHEVMIVVIPIDRADTYPIKQSEQEQKEGVPKRRGIGKATLMTIANAASVEWLEEKRLDDDSDPHFCEFEVIGRYKGVDGQFRPVRGYKDTDLRKGSDQIAKKSDGEVGALRSSMKRSGITKAKLRGLREAFGVPHGVLESELDKPFVFARVIFTGRSNDPYARRMFSQVIAMQQLAATAAMYGGEMPAFQLPAMTEPAKQLPERAIVCNLDGEVIDPPAQKAVQTQKAPPPVPPPPPPPPGPKTGPDGSVLPTPNYVPRIGRSKGKPLCDAPDDDLRWLEGVLAQNAEDPDKAKWRNEALGGLAAVRAELKKRGIDEPPLDEDDPDDMRT